MSTSVHGTRREDGGLRTHSSAFHCARGRILGRCTVARPQPAYRTAQLGYDLQRVYYALDLACCFYPSLSLLVKRKTNVGGSTAQRMPLELAIHITDGNGSLQHTWKAAFFADVTKAPALRCSACRLFSFFFLQTELLYGK